MDVLELVSGQMVLIGLIATVLTFILNFVFERNGTHLGRRWITVILFVIAIVLSVIWYTPDLPAFPDFTGCEANVCVDIAMAFLQAWIAVAMVVIAWAKVIYNVLMEKVFGLIIGHIILIFYWLIVI